MQVDAGELIEQLREKFVVDIDGMETEAEAVAVFDRACVKILVAVHNGQGKKELTSGQKAAITRKANRLARQQEETEQDAGGSPTTVGGK